MRGLVAFFALACALSWGYWLTLLATGGDVTRGAAWPTQVPGLFGPLVAALVVAARLDGRRGLAELLAALTAWRWKPVWVLAVASPLVLLAVGLAIAAVADRAPRLADFGRFSGLPTGVAIVAVALVPLAIGEEVGWRAYALPRLVSLLGRQRGSAVLAVAWGVWHLPLFFLLSSYGGFSPLTVLGFGIGLAAGTYVLSLNPSFGVIGRGGARCLSGTGPPRGACWWQVQAAGRCSAPARCRARQRFAGPGAGMGSGREHSRAAPHPHRTTD